MGNRVSQRATQQIWRVAGQGDLARTLERGVAELGITLAPEATQQLLAYVGELQKWNAAYNLTAVRDPHEMVVRHLLDSLAVLPHVQGRVLDVGAGAGLPGLVLAMADQALTVTVLDSNGKKVRFMRHVVRTLGLVNVTVAEARVETFAPPADAEGYDTIVSRAFASLTDFFSLTRHLLASGGQWVAMKGKLDAPELAAAAAHADIRQTLKLDVPGLEEHRHLVIAQQIA